MDKRKEKGKREKPEEIMETLTRFNISDDKFFKNITAFNLQQAEPPTPQPQQDKKKKNES